MAQDEPVGPASVEELTDALYAGSPADFVADRDDAVRAARERGDRPLAQALARLRRPTRAAWLSNLLARHRAEQLDALLSMAGTLADAQRTLDGDALRQLSARRRKLVTAMAREGGRLAARSGEHVSESLLRELGDILDAALADPDVAREVRSGRLSRSVSYSGFGPDGTAEIDLDAWTAPPPRRPADDGDGSPDAGSGRTADPGTEGDRGTGTSGAADRRDGDGGDERVAGDEGSAGDEEAAERRAAERAEADRREAERIAAERAAAEAARERRRREEALAEAEQAQEEAENRRDEAESAHDAAVTARDAMRERIEQLTAELERAREEDRGSAEAIREAAVALRTAGRTATGAAARADRARERLAELD